MTNKSRKLISFDWAIKKILRSKANFAVLEGFLSELLFDDIIITDVLESESNKDSKEDKSDCLDINVKNSKDEIIIIEIQCNRESDYLQRMLYGASKRLAEHVKEAEAHSKIVKVISINILYFDLGENENENENEDEDDDYIYKGSTVFTGLHDRSQLKLDAGQAKLYKTNAVASEYYLIKVKKFNDIAKDTLDQWIYFLKNEEIKEHFKAKGLAKAKEILDYLKYSEAEKQEYERYKESLHYQESMYESAYVIGKIEGKEEGKIETLKENIIEILKIRFHDMPDELKKQSFWH